MKFILGLTNWHENWELTNKAATEADSAGFWGLSMPDHYLRQHGSKSGTIDSWIALAHLAAKTKKIYLGTMVTPIPLRPPTLLAKVVSSLDVVSKGRTFLGVGAGWSQEEFEAFNVWDEPGVRFSKTAEGVRLLLELWTKEKVEFEGRFYHVQGSILNPKPLQKPHPPLLFGGYGPRMLRLAGRYGDIVFLPPDMKSDLHEAMEIVEKAAKIFGRTTKFSFAMGLPEHGSQRYNRGSFERAIEKAEKIGIEYFDFSVPDEGLLESLKDFAKIVIPSFS